MARRSGTTKDAGSGGDLVPAVKATCDALVPAIGACPAIVRSGGVALVVNVAYGAPGAGMSTVGTFCVGGPKVFAPDLSPREVDEVDEVGWRDVRTDAVASC